MKNKAKEIQDRFSVKRVVAGRGHDMGGLVCDVYFDNRLAATYFDDGWGGETNITFSNDKAEREITDLMNTNIVAEEMYANGWDFLNSAKEIGNHSQLEEIITNASADLERKKGAKKGVQFKAKNAKSEGQYTTTQWGGVTLPTCIKRYGLKRMMQEVEKSIAKHEAEGSTILNKETLRELKLID